MIVRESERDAFLRLGLLLVCGLGLASGFVYAGRQHFAALKLGYKTENLRREREQLADEQRRLLLQREEAASPIRLERAAKQLGMQALKPAQVDPLRQVVNSRTENALKVGPTRFPVRDAGTKSKPATTTQTKRGLTKPI